MENRFSEACVGTVELKRKKSAKSKIEEILKRRKSRFRVLKSIDRDSTVRSTKFKQMDWIKARNFSFEKCRDIFIDPCKVSDLLWNRKRVTSLTPVCMLPKVKKICIRQFQFTPTVLENINSLKLRLKVNKFD